MLEDDGAGLVGAVGDGVGGVGDIAGGLDQDAVVHGDVAQGVGVVLLGAADFYGLVGGVGEEALFAGMDGIEEAFAGELAALEDGEAAGVEGELRVVFEPDGAEWVAVGRAPEGDVLGGEFLLEDGDHGRLVFVDGDGLGERVLEEVVEGVGGDVAFWRASVGR